MHEPKVERKPEPEKDSQGIPKITLKYLKANCEYNRGYNTPELNDVLYLNHRGFRVMENLDEYYNCKVLHMDGNGFRGIQNISHMHNLRSLFLHDNLLTRIEGLTQFAMLDTLNLANNMIEKIEGLENCTKLTKLDMTANKLTDYDSVRQLRYNPNLNILILKENKLQFDERIIEMLSQQMQVKYLHLGGNDFVRNCKYYRRKLVTELPSLTWLDERGVDEEEKRLAKCFLEGGLEAEQRERQRILDEKEERHRQSLLAVREKTKSAETLAHESLKLANERLADEYREKIREAEEQLLQLREENKLLRTQSQSGPETAEHDENMDTHGEEVPLEELQEAYQQAMKDHTISVDVKLEMKKVIDKRIQSDVLGIKSESPVEENEFQQEVVEAKIQEYELSLRRVELQAISHAESASRTDSEDGYVPPHFTQSYDREGNLILGGTEGEEFEKFKAQVLREQNMDGLPKMEDILREMRKKENTDEGSDFVSQSDQSMQIDAQEDIRWTLDMRNSLENLLVSNKFNFELATRLFNGFLLEKQQKEGVRIKLQSEADLRKKWAQFNKRDGPPTEDSVSTIRESDLPEDLMKGVNRNWEDLD